jgi:hypothetical protein
MNARLEQMSARLDAIERSQAALETRLDDLEVLIPEALGR